MLNEKLFLFWQQLPIYDENNLGKDAFAARYGQDECC